MEVESVLVTGANRGIGLEFVRQLAQQPKPPRYVFASYRDPNTLQTLEKVRDASKETQIVLVKMDVRKKNEIEGVRNIIEDTVGDKGLNLLINNAGAFKWLGFPEITEEDLLFHFSNNAVGPVMVLKMNNQSFQPSCVDLHDNRRSSCPSVKYRSAFNISHGTQKSVFKWRLFIILLVHPRTPYFDNVYLKQ
ncbi:uncharacterized protein TNIN_257511 [Trichonephila inaurata madagascariensis]|uniref:Uncharacterized protein n=1 Tax=Trichonephila inaurata madagascariensis TaxID=2747483 RepID=A0A8X6MKH3_9ARAC|nr:uncharacterized protein TNIN_257511 [Trichonephila inaurata madagascariensis]